MSYATWEYYSGSHTAVQTEQEFTRLSRIAARKIDIFTGQRAAGAAGYKADAVRECECQLVDYLHAAEATAQGQGITSVSTDGYSESYQASTPELLEANLRAAAFAWLSGTGLMGAF